jgi:hypothetical protein
MRNISIDKSKILALVFVVQKNNVVCDVAFE